MKGSIRAIGGLLITLGAVGGIETGGPLLSGIVVAAIGLAIMASGTNAMKEAK